MNLHLMLCAVYARSELPVPFHPRQDYGSEQPSEGLMGGGSGEAGAGPKAPASTGYAAAGGGHPAMKQPVLSASMRQAHWLEAELFVN